MLANQLCSGTIHLHIVLPCITEAIAQAEAEGARVMVQARAAARTDKVKNTEYGTNDRQTHYETTHI